MALMEVDYLIIGAGSAGRSIDCPRGKVLGGSSSLNGVDNLRVADASIMPEITSGNTNAPAIMIGEKMSDIILQKS